MLIADFPPFFRLKTKTREPATRSPQLGWHGPEPRRAWQGVSSRNVRCVESAAEAVLAFREWNPDLLVSDIGMPLEDGYSLIRRLRELENGRSPQMPALALTAYASDEDRSRVLSAGFQAHLAKPIEPEILVSSIATALGRTPEGK